MALQTAFKGYLALLTINPVQRDDGKRRLYLVQNRVHQIRTMAERSECTPQFTRLVKETKSQYAKRPDRERDDSWRSSIRHVLQRARIYADALDGDRSDEQLFRRFVAAFTRSESNTDFLAPLEYVAFSADAPLDFGSFRVKKFSEQELITITENDTREIFYPESTLEDTRLLCQYWWLVVSEKSEPDYAGPYVLT